MRVRIQDADEPDSCKKRLALASLTLYTYQDVSVIGQCMPKSGHVACCAPYTRLNTCAADRRLRLWTWTSSCRS